MGHIDPSARISSDARLDSSVEIGAFCIVGPGVRLDANVKLEPSSIVVGETHLREGVHVFPFACLGGPPQDQRHDGGGSRLEIGEGFVIREHVTIHGGSSSGGRLTRVGASCFLMAGAHVGHDARIGDHVVLTNNSSIAGHVRVDPHVVVGGHAGIHQFVRIGRAAMIGAGSMVAQDVPPFSLVQGDRARLIGLNRVGLRRLGFDAARIASIARAWRFLFWGEGSLRHRVRELEASGGHCPEVEALIAFVLESRRGVCRPRGRPGPAEVE